MKPRMATTKKPRAKKKQPDLPDIMSASSAEILAALPIKKRREFLERLGPQALALMRFDWNFFARPKQKTPPGDWVNWLILAGRGFGKALDVETPIPTPDGWSTMEGLRTGDTVFDEAGQPCRVTAVFHPEPKKAYRLVFSDGTSIVACDEHQWVTIDRDEFEDSPMAPLISQSDWAKHRKPITTEQIAATMYDDAGCARHYIPTPNNDAHDCVSIVGCTEVPVPRMKCITVDSPNSMFLAGEGFIPTHNTRTGAEFVRQQVEQGKATRIALVGATAADVRDVMIEGNSGILAVSPPWNKPIYEPSKRRVTWPNGAMATAYSADEPDRLRGPQHDCAWCDELAAWRYDDAWDQLQFGMRLGDKPRTVITTTPRPTPLVRMLAKADTTHITQGSTFDNRANLAKDFFRKVLDKYEGTRLGRQEIYAEILDDVPGALWQRTNIDRLRLKLGGDIPDMVRIVVAIDPAVTSGEDSDETGIIVAGLGRDKHAYVLQDLTCKETPDGWARAAVQAYHNHKADRIVAEVNQGGDLVERVVRTVDPAVSYKSVRASRGKVVRAEPIAALYEQGKVHHVGAFHQLEDQMCTFTPDTKTSPDRVDALVWAMTELMVETRPSISIGHGVDPFSGETNDRDWIV